MELPKLFIFNINAQEKQMKSKKSKKINDFRFSLDILKRDYYLIQVQSE